MQQVLFICSQSPFEHKSGAHQRSNLLFRALQRIGHVHLVCFTTDAPPQVLISESYTVEYFGIEPVEKKKLRLRQLPKALLDPHTVYPLNQRYADVVCELLSRITFSHIVIRYIENVFYCGLRNRTDLIIDVDDLPQQYFFSLFRAKGLSNWNRFFNLYSSLHCYIHVNRLLSHRKHAFYPNPRQVRPTRSSCLPNIPYPLGGVVSTPSESASAKKIIFVGVMDYLPNRTGAGHFITAIWPKVLEKVPDASLHLIGRISSDTIKAFWQSQPQVVVRGYADDLLEEYRSCDLVIAPLYSGAGTSIKVPEAMVQGKACVISKYAARGLSHLLQHGQNIMIARNDRAFASLTIQLLTDAALNRTLGQRAAETASEFADPERFFTNVKQALSPNENTTQL